MATSTCTNYAEESEICRTQKCHPDLICTLGDDTVRRCVRSYSKNIVSVYNHILTIGKEMLMILKRGILVFLMMSASRTSFAATTMDSSVQD
jgi:hypothetical protein